MPDGYTFDLESVRRLQKSNQKVEGLIRTQAGQQPVTTAPKQTEAWVQLTSLTPTAGRYPAQWWLRDSTAATWTAQTDPASVWVLMPNGETPALTTLYRAFCSGVASDGALEMVAVIPGTGGGGGATSAAKFINASVGATVANTVAATTLIGASWDNAGTLVITPTPDLGDCWRLRLAGRLGTQNLSGQKVTVVVKLFDGTNTLTLLTALVAPPANVVAAQWWIDATLDFDNYSALDSKWFSEGLFTLVLGSTAAPMCWSMGAGFVTSLILFAATFDVTAQWDTADPANTITLDLLRLDFVPHP
jgi:hypothetical protein